MLSFIMAIAPYVGYLFMLGSAVYVGWILLELLIEGLIKASGSLSKRIEWLMVHGTFWNSFRRYWMLRFRHVWRDKIQERQGRRKVSE